MIVSCISFAEGDAVTLFLRKELFWGISVFDIIILFGVIIALFSCFRCLGRSAVSFRNGNERKIIGFLFIPLAGIVLFISSGLFSASQVILVSGAYCASYIERFLLAYLHKDIEPLPDFIFPFALSLLLVLDIPVHAAAVIACSYQLCSLCFIFIAGFYPLRDGWYWRNPRFYALQGKI
jgi:hypothetical protein